jgi:hypothetical protein
VEGQSSATGTVTLTAAAPAAGAVVQLESGNRDAAKVPGSVTVAAGNKTATFVVDTSTVPLPTNVTIQATYLGVTKLFVMTVRAPALTPRYNVVSNSKGNNACAIIDASGTVDCFFETSQSTGFIANYLWTLKVGSTETTFTTSSATYTPPTVCANLTGGGTPDSNGAVPMSVTLVLEDRGGNKSSANSTGVSLYTNGRCGY